MTHINKPNLTKLATKLSRLPVDYPSFEMSLYYGNYDTPEHAKDYALNNGGVDKYNCGAVACAVGHGPTAGFLLNPDEIHKDGTPMWDDYCPRVFCEPHTREWNWMFGPTWFEIDNTPHGAAKRIMWLVNDNEIPDDFDCPDDANEDHVEMYNA